MGQRMDARFIGGALVYRWSRVGPIIRGRTWVGDRLWCLRRVGRDHLCLLDLVACFFGTTLARSLSSVRPSGDLFNDYRNLHSDRPCLLT